MMIACNSPVIIVGTPRSGTTLTAKILGRHSRLFMPGETHFYDDVFSRSNELGNIGESGARYAVAERLLTIYGRYNEPADQERINRMFPEVTSLDNALDGCEDYGEVLDRFMRLQMKYVGKQRWGNNAPRDLFSWVKIKKMFPDAKFVVCVRDIRAFLLSYKGKWKTTADDHVERLRKLYNPVVTSYLWKSSMRQLQTLEKTVDSANRIIVRYEDLVTRPEQTVRDICAIIEEEFEPGMLDVNTHNSSIKAESGGIFSTSIDRWKNDLSQEEIGIAQNIGRSELALLGYEQHEANPGKLKVIYMWLSTPFALWRALAANKESRGPLLPYLYRRVISLLGTGKQG